MKKNAETTQRAYEIIYRDKLFMLKGEFYGVIAVLFIIELIFAHLHKINVLKDLLELFRGGIVGIFNLRSTAPLKALDGLNVVGHIVTLIIPFLIVILILGLVAYGIYRLRELYFRIKTEKRIRIVNAIITSIIYSFGLILGAVAIFKMNVNIFLVWLIIGAIIGIIRIILINKKY